MQYASWNKTDFIEAFGGYLYSDFWLRDIFYYRSGEGDPLVWARIQRKKGVFTVTSYRIIHSGLRKDTLYKTKHTEFVTIETWFEESKLCSAAFNDMNQAFERVWHLVYNTN